MKTVNLGVYDILKKNEENSLYDILLCKECLCSCLRNNFSRHKKSPKHLAKTDKKDEGLELIKKHTVFC
jgi:hypothetical protein